MSSGLAALFWGIVTFSLLVVIHEGGHFLAARLFGVKVHEFMIGLPGPGAALRARRRPRYGVTAIPLGGYVRIAGMEPGPEDELLGPRSWPRHATRTGRCRDARRRARHRASARPTALLITLADWDALEHAAGRRVARYRSRFAAEDADDERRCSTARAQSPTAR